MHINICRKNYFFLIHVENGREGLLFEKQKEILMKGKKMGKY